MPRVFYNYIHLHTLYRLTNSLFVAIFLQTTETNQILNVIFWFNYDSFIM